MAWEAGEQLYGRYTIERKLGEGGFGITYLATKKNGDRVVVKTLTDEILQREDFPKFLDRFRDEALRLAVCKHPNIVEVDNTFIHEERFCIAMEYVDGEDLGKLVQRQGYLSETEALQYIWQIGEALTYIHREKGLLHRDVKPPNIMRRRGSSQVVLIDFGLARGFIPGIFENFTAHHDFNFAPPEQFNPDGKQQEYTDVYPLAATLYYLLTAQLPKPAIARQQNSPLTPPKQYNPDIREQVQEAIFQGMVLEEKSRPQSVEEWLAMLPQVNPENDITSSPPVNSQVDPVLPTIRDPLVAKAKDSSLPADLQVASIPSTLVDPLVAKAKDSIYRADPLPPVRISPAIERLRRLTNKLFSPTPLPSKPTFSFEVVTVNSRGQEIKRERRQAEYFREDLGNGVFLDMVSIPGGSFMMGSPASEKQRLNSEGPQHRRTIAAFSMGKYPITQAQWKAVAALPQIERSLNPAPSWFKGDNLPVEQVSWHEAVEFCKRLSRKTGCQYRLPSEAEWEYACRAGTTTPFYFGATIITKLVNYGYYPYADAPKGKYRRKTTEVGSFPANAFGLYDMHGNVWEWCADPWHENYQGVPSDGRVWESGGDDSRRLLRGGSWVSNARHCRSAYRRRNDPGYGVRYSGLRVVALSPVRTQ